MEINKRKKAIAAAMLMDGLEDITYHFLPCKLPRNRYYQTCSMLRCVQEVRYQTDYILGKDHCLIQNMAILDTRYKIDHYLVLGCLRGMTHRYHQCHIGFHTRLPLYPPKILSSEYYLSVPIWKAVPKKPVCESVHASWISEEI